MKLKTYWLGIEYAYAEGNESFGKLKGGFVYSFVHVFDAREALKKTLKKLETIRIEPIEVEFVSLYDKEIVWDDEETTLNFLGFCNEAEKSGLVVMDDFYAYEEV